MDLNQFMQEVHENAVAHGWWDGERSDGTIRALFHCELSEAMEAHRKGEPLVWHQCPYHAGACEKQQPQDDHLHCEACDPAARKPEGVAVELIDCCIRILDYMGKEKLPLLTGDPDEMMLNSVDAYECEDGSIVEYELPDFVDEMHDVITYYKEEHDPVWLDAIIGLCFAWIKHRGIDPVAVMKGKHEYNKTRSYKHGGKVC